MGTDFKVLLKELFELLHFIRLPSVVLSLSVYNITSTAIIVKYYNRTFCYIYKL